MLSTNIKNNRLRKRWTIRDLSDKTSLAISTLSDYENGISKPGPKAISKLAKAFKLTVEELQQGHLVQNQPLTELISDEMYKTRIEESLALDNECRTAIYLLIDRLLQKENTIDRMRQLTKKLQE